MRLENCPLCYSNEARFFHHGHSKNYLRCSECHLVFMSEEDLPKSKEVNQNYSNFSEVKKFRKLGLEKYIGLIINQVLTKIEVGSIGLDYGSGEVSMVQKILSKNGQFVKVFDKTFHPNKELLNDIYDYITLIHQIETYENPREKFDQFYELLAANGVLAIMCTPLEDLSSFNSWRFLKENHHIRFYSEETFKWIAKKYRYDLEILSDGIIIFTQK